MKKFNSLKKTADFGRVYQQGKSYGNKYLVMYSYCRGRDQEGRIGVSVSKRIGNSVVRHLVKRRIKECFRTQLDVFKDGYDIVVVARPAIYGISFDSIKDAATEAAKHLGILELKEND